MGRKLDTGEGAERTFQLVEALDLALQRGELRRLILEKCCEELILLFKGREARSADDTANPQGKREKSETQKERTDKAPAEQIAIRKAKASNPP